MTLPQRIDLKAVRDRIGAYADKIASLEDRTDIYRELIGFGAADIAAGLFQGFAVTGADSRTAVALSSAMAGTPKAMLAARTQRARFTTAPPSIAILRTRPFASLPHSSVSKDAWIIRQTAKHSSPAETSQRTARPNGWARISSNAPFVPTACFRLPVAARRASIPMIVKITPRAA